MKKITKKFRLGDHGRPSRNRVTQAKSGIELHLKKKKQYLLIHSINTYKRTEVTKLYCYNSLKLEREPIFLDYENFIIQ